MLIYINVKSAGSRKNFIKKEEIILDRIPETLEELIKDIVTKNVIEYNNKVQSKTIIEYLTDEEIKSSIKVGKVSFGEIYNEGEADVAKAIEVALLAYKDGIYRVFIGDEEVKELNESLNIKEGDILTFIRLTMLSGGMW